MSNRSPIVSGQPFSLPYVDVVSPIQQVQDTASEESEPNLAAILARVSRPASGPVAVLNRFMSLGIPRDRPGIRHSLYFAKRPVSNLYTIQDDCRISGYLSYSYLLSGSVVVGIVFSTDNSKTLTSEYKLVVRNKEMPKNFTPNFNLEKMGLLMFIAEDSSTLVIPNDVESSLLVRTD